MEQGPPVPVPVLDDRRFRTNDFQPRPTTVAPDVYRETHGPAHAFPMSEDRHPDVEFAYGRSSPVDLILGDDISLSSRELHPSDRRNRQPVHELHESGRRMEEIGPWGHAPETSHESGYYRHHPKDQKVPSGGEGHPVHQLWSRGEPDSGFGSSIRPEDLHPAASFGPHSVDDVPMVRQHSSSPKPGASLPDTGGAEVRRFERPLASAPPAPVTEAPQFPFEADRPSPPKRRQWLPSPSLRGTGRRLRKSGHRPDHRRPGTGASSLESSVGSLSAAKQPFMGMTKRERRASSVQSHGAEPVPDTSGPANKARMAMKVLFGRSNNASRRPGGRGQNGEREAENLERLTRTGTLKDSISAPMHFREGPEGSGGWDRSGLVL